MGKFRWAGSIDEFKKSNDPYVFQFRHGEIDGPMQPRTFEVMRRSTRFNGWISLLGGF